MKYVSSAHVIDAAGAAAALLLCGVAYVGVVGPELAARGEMEQARLELSRSWTDASQRREALAEAQRAFDEARAAASKAVSFASVNTLNDRLGRLATAVESCGAKLTEVIPAAPIKAGAFDRIQIRIAGEATYPQAIRLLDTLDQLFPDTEVVSFSLSGSPETPDTPARLGADLAWYTLEKPGKGK